MVVNEVYDPSKEHHISFFILVCSLSKVFLISFKDAQVGSTKRRGPTTYFKREIPSHINNSTKLVCYVVMLSAPCRYYKPCSILHMLLNLKS